MSVTKAVNIDKFRGLNYNKHPRYIGEQDLAEATNVWFDNEGYLTSRYGCRAWTFSELISNANPPTVSDPDGRHANDYGSNYTWHIGNYLGRQFFATGGRYWDRTPTTEHHSLQAFSISENQFADEGLINFMGSSNYIGVGRGARYVEGSNEYIYWPCGYKGNSAGTFPATPDWPAAFLAGHPISDPGASGDINDSWRARILLHKDRLWLTNATDKIDRLWFSAPGDPTDWTSASAGFIDVEPGRTGHIVGIEEAQDRIIIFKTDSIWVLFTNGNPNQWSLRKIQDYGCFDHCITKYKDIIYFGNQLGFYATDGVSFKRISKPLDSLFEMREFYSKDLTSHHYMPLIPLAAYDDRLFCLVFDGDVLGSFTSKRLFCYDINYDAWTEIEMYQYLQNLILDIFAIEEEGNYPNNGLYFTGYSPYDERAVVYRLMEGTNSDEQYLWAVENAASGTTTQINFSYAFPSALTSIIDQGIVYARIMNASLQGQTRLVTGYDSVSRLYVETEAFTNAVGTRRVMLIVKKPFDIRIKTKAFDFGDPHTIKKLRKGYFKASVNGDVTAKIHIDDQYETTNTVDPNEDAGQGVFPINGNVRGQNMQVELEVTDSESGPVDFNGITLLPVIHGELGESNDAPDNWS